MMLRRPLPRPARLTRWLLIGIVVASASPSFAAGHDRAPGRSAGQPKASAGRKVLGLLRGDRGATPRAKTQLEHQIEQLGPELQRLTLDVPKRHAIADPDGVLDSERVTSHSFDPKTRKLVVLTSRADEVLERLELEPSGLRGVGAFLGSYYLPRKSAISADYWRHRLPQITSATLSSMLGFFALQAGLESQVATYGAEHIRDAAFITGVLVPQLTKATDLLLSRQFGPLGDRNPKRMFLLSTLLAGGTAIFSTLSLAHWPAQFVPVTIAVAVLGSIAGAVGLGVGVNIFNHLAEDVHARGEVNVRNHNQDQFATMIGTTIGGTLAALTPLLSQWLGWDPSSALVGAVGLGMLTANFTAACGLRLEQLTRHQLGELVDQQLAGQGVKQAEWQRPRQVLMGLFRGPQQGEFSPRTRFATTVDDALGLAAGGARGHDAKLLLDLFAKDDYLLRVDPASDKVVVGLKAETRFEQVLRSLIHARMAEQALDAPLFGALKRWYGERAPLALAELTARALPDTAALEDAFRTAGWNVNPRSIKIDRLPVDSSWSRPDAALRRPSIPLERYREMLRAPDQQRAAIEQALEASLGQSAAAR